MYGSLDLEEKFEIVYICYIWQTFNFYTLAVCMLHLKNKNIIQFLDTFFGMALKFPIQVLQTAVNFTSLFCYKAPSFEAREAHRY